ncbi:MULTISPECIES: CerR family C-terminal domain-containing protein [unclassified Janthinobacterium]|jgi:AcrR family transcriptional regulator|uniref:CerR family C-terminal domain-containing protein n=1 Tax=unclassified Janthinobacterium TaxID=2610881 RepID=UPI0016216D07|nr:MULTISPECIES: CerR family C-terminal domain-containing protein [unclassified Janthinobacterium]MBB5607970.1 AcrR family transcriptional regulator [Janthinobacterium sp. S3T4]MBB5613289.1 AcrR family transcriptional regulator [Janthinobacterium sp. S3M3]
MIEKDNPHTPGADDGRKPRSDGEQSRERLLHSAIRLFAEQGYANTSTRELAQAAGTNVAAISYYFGDKAGLYRAVFAQYAVDPQVKIARYDQPHFSLRLSLEGFYAQLLAPMLQSGLVRDCLRLWFREVLEPTGLWAREFEQNIRPEHEALTRVLARHLGAPEDSDDMHRLAFSIAAMALQQMIAGDVLRALRPQLLATPQATQVWLARMVDYALAMAEVERQRLHLSPPNDASTTAKGSA